MNFYVVPHAFKWLLASIHGSTAELLVAWLVGGNLSVRLLKYPDRVTDLLKTTILKVGMEKALGIWIIQVLKII